MRKILLPGHPVAKKLELLEEFLRQNELRLIVGPKGQLGFSTVHDDSIFYGLENREDPNEFTYELPRAFEEEILAYDDGKLR